jgi:hypothetical protein
MEHHRRRHDQRAPGRRRPRSDGGFSMIATVLVLLIVAAGSALLLGTTLNSGGGTSSTGTASGPGVAQADRVQAQQSLTTGLEAAQTAAEATGGFSGVTPSGLQASNPSVTFVNGPSSGPTTVSVTVSDIGASSAGGGSVSDGVGGVPSIPGLAGGGGAGTGNGTSTAAAGVTLADRSSDGVCWLIWKSSQSATWYGAQTGLTSCSAPPLSAAPTPRPVSASAIGWQQGGFPSP